MEHAAGAHPPIYENKWVISNFLPLGMCLQGIFWNDMERFVGAQLHPLAASPGQQRRRCEKPLEPICLGDGLKQLALFQVIQNYKWLTRDGNTVNPIVCCFVCVFFSYGFLRYVHIAYIYINYKHICLAYTFLAQFSPPPKLAQVAIWTQ